MKAIKSSPYKKMLILCAIVFCVWGVPLSFADIYINVMAVNATDVAKTSSIKFDLPGELTVDDILDTNGLQLDYNVDDANYFVYGDVTLKPKESKTFRVHVKDKWVVTGDQVEALKKQIDQGYESLGKPHDAPNADILKTRLEAKIDYVVGLQTNSAESIDKRIDNYRAYAKEIKRIQNDALNVSYWRSDPNSNQQPKLVHLTIQIQNPTKALKHFKHKDYLPGEVKPENVVEAEGFEVRYDQVKQLAFLFKEEDLASQEKKKYTIGILDIWLVDQKDIDYLRSRTQAAVDFLKDTRFKDSATMLADSITEHLQAIEASQAVVKPILEHISAYRVNKSAYNDAEKNVENLEKLLSVFREDLEKSKIENILQKMQALKSVRDISQVVLYKKFESGTAWGYIKLILLFVGFITLVYFIVWILRSKDKKAQ